MDFEFLATTFRRLLAALPLTLDVWALSIVLGGAIALGLTWARASGIKPLEWFARGYVFIFRGSPLLVQLFVVYYGLASFPAVRASIFWPLLRDAFFCATLSLALCTAAYQSEIFRMALAAIPPGQIEAARACGMSGPTLFRRVIFPIALRQALPAYTTELISMTKATALVSLVTLWDVMSVALKIRNDTLVTYTPLLAAGLIYFVVNYILARAFSALEFALTPHLRNRPLAAAPVPDVL
jgi:octopine/nopaline transport system permease protein